MKQEADGWGGGGGARVLRHEGSGAFAIAPSSGDLAHHDSRSRIAASTAFDDDDLSDGDVTIT